MRLVCAPCCNSSACWCRDYKSRWIASLDAMQTVEQIGYERHGKNDVIVFRYRVTERHTA